MNEEKMKIVTLKPGFTNPLYWLVALGIVVWGMG